MFIACPFDNISWTKFSSFCPKIDRKAGSKTYDVTMDDAAIIGGPFGYPLEMKNKFILELL